MVVLEAHRFRRALSAMPASDWSAARRRKSLPNRPSSGGGYRQPLTMAAQSPLVNCSFSRAIPPIAARARPWRGFGVRCDVRAGTDAQAR